MSDTPTNEFNKPPLQNQTNAAIGVKIRELRRRSNLTLKELALRVKIGPQQLQKIETTNTRVSAVVIVNIAMALDVDASDLIPPVHEIIKSREDTFIPKEEILDQINTQLSNLGANNLELVRAVVEKLSITAKN